MTSHSTCASHVTFAKMSVQSLWATDTTCRKPTMAMTSTKQPKVLRFDPPNRSVANQFDLGMYTGPVRLFGGHIRFVSRPVRCRVDCPEPPGYTPHTSCAVFNNWPLPYIRLFILLHLCCRRCCLPYSYNMAIMICYQTVRNSFRT